MQQQGYEIREQNYQTRYGEIDIIAEKENTIVFVEVKYRTSDRYGDPLEAVHPAKQKKISRVASGYYSRYYYNRNVSCRFDVIAVYGTEKVVHIENAFCFK